MTALDYFVDIGIKLHLREWPGKKTTFVLLHGLSSNAQTWDMVASQLAEGGHRVIAVDQRGHGLSDKPDNGYDFATITADLAGLIQELQLHRPILVGQSWGGNVLLEFGARYPELACAFGFVDGGFLNLKSRPGATWEKISTELKPPNLRGTPRQEIKDRLKAIHPDWSEAGIEATLANFNTLPDGAISPWLTLPRHMAILRSMWEQQVENLYAQVKQPVLICAAIDNKNPDWMKVKRAQVSAAETQIPQATVHWFEDTAHDIHVHRPQALANLFLDTLNNGVWNDCNR